ncbi:ras-specific guanine nucleotide-releasing factor RalGPS2-like isoform X2 [Hydractinia symbiolongicarpus]|uniref:ras-specific guanine nucleotide-releasing factor RalGPS2-like isoform X2 n=1 Tax=Hydractinia symbiolongicarpus TaxID=13093 RepID=UPI00254F02C6|nr:ras-specific guanine nucleotide-releasing factor RalGPS2-like isoform X2 [Hydractinia symbiolongicarpus]
MDGIGVLIKSSGRRSFNEYDHISFPPQRLRRKTWCGFSNETDRCFFKIVEVNDEQCSQVMNKNHSSLIATNPAVVKDLELNFGDNKCVESLQQSKEFDAVVFDVLKVQPEDVAELTSCCWTSKKKYEICPNVVNFTKRFNQVSYWVTREVLNSNTAKNRAEKLIYLIKVAKKLFDLNNLNSLKAVVSGLQSAPIYRLTKTWNLIPKRDKEKLEKLNELVAEDNNRIKFREYIQTVKLPCIPYLGMYLTDLTYINTIHPLTGGLDVARTNKMNEILRIIADFQQSTYDLKSQKYIQEYLNSIKYIDELQKFMEDENYKLSQKIEPSTATLRESKDLGRRRREIFSESDETYRLHPKAPLAKSNSLRDKPKSSNLTVKSSSLNLPNTPFRSPSPDKKVFTPGHRKVKSLGSNQQLLASLSALNTLNLPGSQSSSVSNSGGSRYNLMDDTLLEDQSNGDIHASTSYESGLDQDQPETHPIIQNFEPPAIGCELSPCLPDTYFKLQGFLKRKTCLKNGYKPKVTSWQRYWVGITCSCLIYFLPRYRAFGGHERTHFRQDPHKILPLHGCTVFVSDIHSDSFRLTEDRGSNVYQFRAGTQANAKLWCKYIAEASDDKKLTPANLITFDESDDDNTRL